MPGKKENNRKNFQANQDFKAHQKEDRPKQVWNKEQGWSKDSN